MSGILGGMVSMQQVRRRVPGLSAAASYASAAATPFANREILVLHRAPGDAVRGDRLSPRGGGRGWPGDGKVFQRGGIMPR
ncbi:hypothetical protein [Novosphingobium album (ex Liu et al. 2023)]|uniref:Uncharacterized protein n=1 Tax=Novosphingobium album (ex Liu et al. 2023) TaxID=3031130 RepID=A0ABT5WMA7_9SPHN|nr:hypothetical protein [Novosphingobium album (ex Liu et al. 2023)]MDE8651184.1 hypothetical protein [Novosphingobium album (ex Liu et al. 2023)]